MTQYRNSWHNSKDPYSGPAFYTTDAVPEEYKGYLIYNRINSVSGIESGACVYDIVKDDVCVGQYAGPDGARRAIDSGRFEPETGTGMER
jgi:hypothetical protein